MGLVLKSQEACRQWNWCTGLDACCRIQWYGWRHLGKPFWPPQAHSTLVLSLCIQTWEASTWSSSVHRSNRGICGSHGTRIHAARPKTPFPNFYYHIHNCFSFYFYMQQFYKNYHQIENIYQGFHRICNEV